MKIIVSLVPENGERVKLTQKHNGVTQHIGSLDEANTTQIVLNDVEYGDEIAIFELEKSVTETDTETTAESDNGTGDNQDVDTPPVLGDTTPS